MKKHFFDLPDNRSAYLYQLRLEDGFGADITDFGGCLVSLFVPDRHGNLTDVVLGWKNPEKYITNPAYLGALVGRIPNRISNGRFELDGKIYQMVLNDRRASTLHGGFSYAHRLWQLERHTATELELSLTSPDGDAGFPGTVQIKVLYKLHTDHTLEFSFEVRSDKTTVADLTNHAYFNLDGDASGPCDEHTLQLKSDYVTEVNQLLQPTGKSLDVTGTFFDVRQKKKFKDIFAAIPNGFDHNFILGNKNNTPHDAAVIAEGGSSGIRLTMHTDRPGVQIYMGGASGEGKNGTYVPCGGFCLETQNWPDAVNHPDFPSVRLEPGEKLHGRTLYNFSIAD